MTRFAWILALVAGGCAAHGLPLFDGPVSDGGVGSPAHDLGGIPHDLSASHDGGGQPVDLAHFPLDMIGAGADMTLSAAPCLTGGSVVHLQGDPGAYIFSGVETDQITTWSPVNGDPDTFWYEAFPGWWLFAFSSRQLGQPLAVGRYDGAMRVEFEASGHPGLDISGNGRGCNTETGWFEILSISGGPANGGFNELTAIFEQHCEGGTPALRGCIHYER